MADQRTTSVQPEKEHQNDTASSTRSPDGLVNSQAGRRYWENADASVNGMLGGVLGVEGFSSVSRIDIQGSRTFLARLGIGAKHGRKSVASALESGAGVGRITDGLLLPVAEYVDIIEPISRFTDCLRTRSGVRDIFNVGMEEWAPAVGTEYDLIWTQWCLNYLTDEQVIQYLNVCKTTLRPKSGLMVVKENLSTANNDIFDDADSSVTRQDEKFRALFEAAGLTIIRTDLQRGFPEIPPKRLFPVRMYALKP